MLQALVVDQWKVGGAAELRVSCESGHLRVSVSADFGPSNLSWRADSASLGGSCTTSRQRRRQRRAAARTAAEMVATERNAAEQVAGKSEESARAEKAPERAFTENAAAEKAAAKKSAAEKAVVETLAADNVSGGKDTAEKANDEEAAAPSATVAFKENYDEKNAILVESDSVASTSCSGKMTAAEVASTSSCGKGQMTCWNCDQEMTVDHQCEVPPVRNKPWPSPPPPSTSDAVAPHRSRSLNIKKFCVKCEERHPVGQKCQCQSAEEAVKPRVKCCVCKVLGRETTVLVGSRCQSCGVTAR